MKKLVRCPECGAKLRVDADADLDGQECPECEADLAGAKTVKQNQPEAVKPRRRRSERRPSSSSGLVWIVAGGIAVVVAFVLIVVIYVAFNPGAPPKIKEVVQAEIEKEKKEELNIPGMKGLKKDDLDKRGIKLKKGGRVAGTYQDRRTQIRTRLTKHGPAPGEVKEGPPPKGFETFPLRSKGKDLKAWVRVPDGAASKPNPAILFLHDGWGLDPASLAACQPFVDKGFVVLAPTYRGENGNSGDFEFFFGEVDDAIAAIKKLSEQKYVDKSKIYVFGHGQGGAIAGLLSMMPDVPVVHTASVGGLYAPDTFEQKNINAPFDVEDSDETELRLVLGNLRYMLRPHHVYIGDRDTAFRPSEALADKEAPSIIRKMMPVTIVSGDHAKSIDPAIEEYINLIESKK